MEIETYSQGVALQWGQPMVLAELVVVDRAYLRGLPADGR